MKTRTIFSAYVKLQTLKAGLFLCCMAMQGAASAGSLPKGNCADPKPYTDLRHCRFEGADLRNIDLSGADMRGVGFHNAQLQGANLTNALFNGGGMNLSMLDNVKGISPIGLAISKNNYLVEPNLNSKSLIKLSPHEAVQGIRENIAGQQNIHMASKTEGNLNTLAILDWPRGGEGGMMTIVARFDNNNFDVPACAQSVNLTKDDHYFYPHWDSMKVKSLANGTFLIGVHAYSVDSDGEGMGGWDMVAFMKLTSNCDLSVLHKEDSTWSAGFDQEGCRDDHMDYRFLDDKTAEIVLRADTCAKSKAKVTRKKIKFNLSK